MTATWTNPKTWTAAVLTSSDMNTYVRDNFDYMYGQIPQAYAAGGRLTLTSGDPYATNVTNAGTLYYTPATGDRIALFSGTKWTTYTFEELSLSVASMTASRPHDIYIYNNSGTPALVAIAWTNDTTRASALVYQNGVYVRSGVLTRRFLGTVWVDSGNKLQDLPAFRYVSNLYNAVPRVLYVAEATNHTYNGAARLWNNSNTNNQINWVTCHPSGASMLAYFISTMKAGADASYAKSWFYLDGAASAAPVIASANYNNQYVTGGITGPISAVTGFHYANLYEVGNHASSTFDSMTLGAWGEF